MSFLFSKSQSGSSSLDKSARPHHELLQEWPLIMHNGLPGVLCIIKNHNMFPPTTSPFSVIWKSDQQGLLSLNLPLGMLSRTVNTLGPTRLRLNTVQTCTEGTEARSVSMPASTIASSISWKCTICEHVNDRDNKCAQCGIVKGPSTSAPLASKSDSTPWTCSLCGWTKNHPAVGQCDECESPRKETKQQPVSTTRSSLDTFGHSMSKALPHTAPVLLPPSVEFMFGSNQAMSDFCLSFAKLFDENATDDKEKNPSSAALSLGGVGTIIKSVEERTATQTAALTTSFQDIDRLMEKAGELVKMAEMLRARLGTTDTSPEAEQFRLIIETLGIKKDNDALVGMRGSSSSGSNSITDSLITATRQILQIKRTPMMTLAELWCYYNRALRAGQQLFSPQDLLSALQSKDSHSDTFQLLARMGKVLVVSNEPLSEQFARIASFVQSRYPRACSALAWSEHENVSLTVAQEQLGMACKQGMVCMDSGGVGGFMFYPNLIIDFEA